MTPTLGTRPVSSVGFATNWRLSTIDNQTHPDWSFDRQKFLYGRLSICFSSCIFHSCIFHHCYLLLLLPLLQFPLLMSSSVVSTPAFSTPAVSAPPAQCRIKRNAKPACSPPGTNVPAKLRVYWTKVNRIFLDTEESSAVLMRSFTLRSGLIHCGMPAHKMKMACQFLPICTKIRLP